MKITDIRINHKKMPIGYLFNSITISYKIIESLGNFQTLGRIEVSLNDSFEDTIFDTTLIAEIDPTCYILNLNLKPRTRYYVRVTSVSNLDEVASSVTYFETGKMEEKWDAKWLSVKDNDTNPIFRKKFSISKEVKKARLYISGLGLFTAYLNNKKISNEYLTPYLNNYNRFIQVITFDVLEYLKDNDNVLDVKLGDGWYKGPYAYMKPNQPCFKDEYALIYELILEYTDGTEEKIISNENIECFSSNIIKSTIYNGEYRDDTKEVCAYQPFIIDGYPNLLKDRISVPVRIREVFKPIELIKTPKDELVLDLGQNFGGIFSLHVNVEKGTKIHLQFGEILQDGCFHRDNLRRALAEYTYISDGKEKDLIPEFTFYGYRYCKIEGITNLKIDDFKGLAIYSEIDDTLELKTNNELINKLINNIRWGLKSNFIDIPCDCPQRDERLGWTGDAQVFSSTAMFFTNCYSFFEKYLYDMHQEQLDCNGMVPKFIPSCGEHATSSAWGDAVTVIPTNLFNITNDINVLKDNYQSMMDWINYCINLDGTDFGYGRTFHYGDWLALDREINPVTGKENLTGKTSVTYIAYCYLLISLNNTLFAASKLNKTDDVEKLETYINYYQQYLIDNYINKDGSCKQNTQTGVLLATKLHLGNNDALREQLVKLFIDNDYKLQTGFVGTPILNLMLSKLELDEIAFKLLLNEDYPGWIYPIKLGATTIWERWNSVLPDGHLNPAGMNSLNHYAYGSIGEWIIKDVVGLKQEENSYGFKQIVIAPRFSSDLNNVECKYKSVSGDIKVTYKIENDNISLNLSIPFNTTCRVILPKEYKNDIPLLTKGEYNFKIKK